MNQSRSILTAGLFLLVMNTCYSQVYLGMISKEGIFLCENSINLRIQKYGYDSYDSYQVELSYQEKLNSLSYNSMDNVIFDDYRGDFKVFTNIKIGKKFYISCSENVTRESVSGYIIYNSQGLGREFYPLISNKTNLCSFNSYDYPLDYGNLVIISNDSIAETIGNVPVFNYEVLSMFKQRVLQDVKNFEISTDNLGYSKVFINNIDDNDLVAFSGSFCNKFQEEYFVSYSRRNDEECVNANYVMDSNAKVIDFFTTPRKDYGCKRIIGVCDYDGDGIDEILIDVQDYEGGGYELWKYINRKFTKVAEGFYFSA